jgi:hypothetical protein
MTTRKPAGLSFPDWIESQIQDAQAAGAFDDLPGTGKPIADIDSPQHELAWVANYLRRENVEVAPLLPPALALAKEVEALPERLSRVRSETEARRAVEDLNARIRRAYAAPADGPPMRVKAVDVELTLERWRRAAVPAAAVEPAQSPVPAPRTRTRRWFGRRR